MTNIEKFQDGEVGLFTGDDVLNAKKFSKEDRVYILTKKIKAHINEVIFFF